MDTCAPSPSTHCEGCGCPWTLLPCWPGTPQPGFGFGRLRTVNCSQRGLKVIPANLPTDLMALDLSHNSLDVQQLGEKLCGFKSLQSLSLSFTDLTTMSDILKQCSSLLELNLTGNRLDRLAHATFQDLRHLRRLVGLEVDALDSDQVFRELTNMKDLDLIFHGDSLPQGLFDNLVIQNLNLVLTQAWALPASVFGFGGKTLHTLQLVAEQVKELDEDLLDGLSVLRKLFLVVPSVQQLPARFFHSQQLAGQAGRPASLQKLDITGVHCLPPMLFNQLASLETLQLKEISSFPQEGLMAQVVNLRMLDIRDSTLTAIPGRWFQELYSLATLTLIQLQLRSLHDDALQGLISLTHLDLSDNMLESVSSTVLAPASKTLQTLVLTSNLLTTMGQHDLSGLRSLRYLDLSYNRLASLDSRCLAGLTFLKVLYLNNNRLTSLPRHLFQGLRLLERLSLAGNYLVEFPSALLQLKGSLTTLDLSTNALHSVPAYQLCQFQYLLTLRLAANKLHCNCSVLAFQLCSDIRVHGECHTPAEHKDRSIKEVPMPQSCLASVTANLATDPQSGALGGRGGVVTVIRKLFPENNSTLASQVKTALRSPAQSPGAGPAGLVAGYTSDTGASLIGPPPKPDSGPASTHSTAGATLPMSGQGSNSTQTLQTLLQTDRPSQTQGLNTAAVGETQDSVMAGEKSSDDDAAEKSWPPAGATQHQSRPGGGRGQDEMGGDNTDSTAAPSIKELASPAAVEGGQKEGPIPPQLETDREDTALSNETNMQGLSLSPQGKDLTTTAEKLAVKKDFSASQNSGEGMASGTAQPGEGDGLATDQQQGISEDQGDGGDQQSSGQDMSAHSSQETSSPQQRTIQQTNTAISETDGKKAGMEEDREKTESGNLANGTSEVAKDPREKVDIVEETEQGQIGDETKERAETEEGAQGRGKEEDSQKMAEVPEETGELEDSTKETAEMEKITDMTEIEEDTKETSDSGEAKKTEIGKDKEKEERENDSKKTEKKQNTTTMESEVYARDRAKTEDTKNRAEGSNVELKENTEMDEDVRIEMDINGMMGDATVEDTGRLSEQSAEGEVPDSVQKRVDPLAAADDRQLGKDGQSDGGTEPVLPPTPDSHQTSAPLVREAATPPLWASPGSSNVSSLEEARVTETASAIKPMPENLLSQMGYLLENISNPQNFSTVNTFGPTETKLRHTSVPLESYQKNKSVERDPVNMSVSSVVSSRKISGQLDMSDSRSYSPFSNEGPVSAGPVSMIMSDSPNGSIMVSPKGQEASEPEESTDTMAFNFIVSSLTCLAVFGCTLLSVYCVRRWQQKGTYIVSLSAEDGAEMNLQEADSPPTSDDAAPEKEPTATAYM